MTSARSLCELCVTGSRALSLLVLVIRDRAARNIRGPYFPTIDTESTETQFDETERSTASTRIRVISARHRVTQ